jgi:hypothetical protein
MKAMMALTTVSEKIDDSKARVFWATGLKNSGILDVYLDFAHEDCALLAELIALRYLLFKKKVFDREPGGGGGYRLTVSKGAIKKLANKKSSKKHAFKFSSFLTNRMDGVVIEVSQAKTIMPSIDDCEPEIIGGEKGVYARTFDEITVPAIGRLLVTQHAVDQYQSRISSGAPKNPWASLVKRLSHPSLRVFPLDPKVLAHKARKYGRSDNVEAWSHPTSSFIYLVIRNDDDERVLVTVFEL